MFLTYIYITLLLPSFVLTLCICLDYFIEGHRVISYTSTVTCYPLKIKSLPLPLPLRNMCIPRDRRFQFSLPWHLGETFNKEFKKVLENTRYATTI